MFYNIKNAIMFNDNFEYFCKKDCNNHLVNNTHYIYHHENQRVATRRRSICNGGN